MAGSSITASSGSSPAAAQSSSTSFSSRVGSTAAKVGKHIVKHTGTGIVCAVAYFDPGNWGVDLQAGSQFGYKLLFIVLLAGLIAVFMQCLASRLGVVTGLDLASHCRLLLHDRPKHTRFWRWAVLYPLYVLSETAIVATDLAELLGSAIALTLMFPSLPLYAGVILTALDVLLLLGMRDPLGGAPVKPFEFLIAGLVFTVLICMGVIVSKASVHWGDAFDGFIPSSAVVSPGGLYTAIGILGATVMPHSLFLGSALATQSASRRRTNSAWESTPTLGEKTRSFMTNVKAGFSKDSLVGGAKRVFQMGRVAEEERPPKNHAEHENHDLGFVRRHLTHGIVDMVVSLLGLALVVNALIVILASAVFFFGANGGPGNGPATLFDAYDLLVGKLGKAAATLFALALLAAGQSSSIVATLAGQVISEGFIRWKVSPVLRRLLTRSLGLIPSVIIAAALGKAGVSALLVISQVVLSIVLPFIVFPLLYLCSSKEIMSVKTAISGHGTAHKKNAASQSSSSFSTSSGEGPPESWSELDVSDPQRWQSQTTLAGLATGRALRTVDVEAAEEIVDYSMGKISMVFGWSMWLLIVLANGYAIVTLALGEDA
ncbi:natural resistance-associated macrophage protein-domain-containing protein [Fomitopsis serialis]|uniref:natural resistance-associated macrophage protein-domain-containing protein n=1 Tax=Fomitopsis serialis TaxID=139415 RepID=UPI002008C670|nr:natural resistance-associated macrophage protein-domain-containing protein [Neoantrodia serialis]KAH9929791.1 natural resistance-associated macrophage protein-domain-containing protein [Neoantrodia serialis]